MIQEPDLVPADRESIMGPDQALTPSTQARLNPLALASLALGIAGWIMLPALGAVAAVITGHLSRIQIAESAGRMGGRKLAMAGLVLGWLQIGLIAGVMLAVIIIGLKVRPGLIRLAPW